MKRFSTLALMKCVAIAGMASMLNGCVGLAIIGAQEVMVAGSGEEERLAKVIIDGATSKQELIAQLGVPLHELGDGSVLIFGGHHRSRGLLQLVKDDKGDEHRLIAILDKNELLREHLWVGKKATAKNIQTAVTE